MMNFKWQQIIQSLWCADPNNLWSAIRILCSFLIGTVCICGDYFMTKLTIGSHLSLALIDNITHGLVGVFVALVIISYFHNQVQTFEIILSAVLSYVVSSVVDLDHFIEARSISIEEATRLSHRPFLHNTTIIITLYISVLFFKRRPQNFLRKLPLLIPVTGVLVHHTRDAVRRGYWMYPFGSTPALPYPFYILISIIIPNIYYLVFIFTYQNYNILSSNSDSFFV